MTRPYLVGIAGNTQRPSRTYGLTEAILGEIAGRQAVDVDLYDLAGLGADLGATLDRRQAPERLAELIDAIEAADALVVASPVYKGAYSGLFKHLFDLLDPKALAGKPLVVAATGGSERHSLVIEHSLRPLFGFFGAAITPTGVYGTEKEFLDHRPTHPALLARIAQAADEASRHIAALAPRQPIARIA